MKAYFCTSFGDISLEKGRDDTVVLKTTDLTSGEEKLLRELVKKFKIKDLSDKQSLENREVVLENVTLEHVHKHMKKVLKKDKPTITAIKYKDNTVRVVESLKDGEGEVAVTTDKPRKGCPMPEMIRSEMRASAVLTQFLDDTQKKDFEAHRQIIARGNWTCKPYLITSRYSPEVEKFGQLYDVGDKWIVCASCKEIPPSEEILALKIMIEHREHEFLYS